MSIIDELEYKDKVKRTDVLTEDLRDHLIRNTKDFKRSWVELGRGLYTVYRDKLYYTWGYEKFDNYTESELGIRKPTALKMLKSYFFLEQEEPEYLKGEYASERGANTIPDCDAVNVLRLAKRNKELTKGDYIKIKKDIFENGKDAASVRKDLTALMRERKEVDPDEEREERNRTAVKRLVGAIKLFQKDMEALKLLNDDLVKEAYDLMNKLEAEVA